MLCVDWNYIFKVGKACFIKKWLNVEMHAGRRKILTLIFLLKFLSFLFFMYLWIFLFLSSTESLPTLNVGSSKLEISDATAEEAVVVVAPPWYRCWLSLLTPLIHCLQQTKKTHIYIYKSLNILIQTTYIEPHSNLQPK